MRGPCCLLLLVLSACHTDHAAPDSVDGAASDVDGGDVDMASPSVSFGGFVDHSDALPDVSQSTTDVQLVDLDGDGRLDLVWTSQDWPATGAVQIPGSIEITINDGGGHFHDLDMSGLDTQGTWQFVLPVDIDGDGDRDLLLSRAAVNPIELLLLVNDGAAHFTVGTGLPAITGATDGLVFGRVVATDFDKDGRIDLALPIFTSGDQMSERPNVLLMNKGGGQFERDTTGRIPPLPTGLGYTLSLAVGDVNGDGATDLFLGIAEHRQRILINDGTGRFSDQSDDDGMGMPRLPATELRAYHSEIVDLNDDGKLDIVVINDAGTTSGTPVTRQNQVFVNDGTGHFTLGWMAPNMTQYDSRGLAFGDINDDGLLDVVVGNANMTLTHAGNAIQAALGKGGGTFDVMGGLGTWPRGVFGVAVGDLNGDGYADIAGAVAEPDATTGSLHNLLLLSTTVQH